MKFFTTLLSGAAALDLSAPVHDPAMIAAINAAGAGWVSGINQKFETATLADAKRLLGTNPDKKVAAALRASLPFSTIEPLKAVPVKCVLDIVEAQRSGDRAERGWRKTPS